MTNCIVVWRPFLFDVFFIFVYCFESVLFFSFHLLFLSSLFLYSLFCLFCGVILLLVVVQSFCFSLPSVTVMRLVFIVKKKNIFSCYANWYKYWLCSVCLECLSNNGFEFLQICMFFFYFHFSRITYRKGHVHVLFHGSNMTIPLRFICFLSCEISFQISFIFLNKLYNKAHRDAFNKWKKLVYFTVLYAIVVVDASLSQANVCRFGYFLSLFTFNR